MTENRSGIYDSLCLLNAPTLATIVANTAGRTAGGTATYFDTGGGFTEGRLVVDLSFAASAAASDGCELLLQGSNVSTFGTIVTLCKIGVGNGTRVVHTSAVKTGRLIANWNNMFGSTVYRYLRIYARGLGTWATGIKYGAFLTN
jgi:hypothetical protein